MHRVSDRATLLVRKVHDTEREFARTKRVRDLTKVIKYADEAKSFIGHVKIEPEKHRGCPIGQRWN